MKLAKAPPVGGQTDRDCSMVHESPYYRKFKSPSGTLRMIVGNLGLTLPPKTVAAAMRVHMGRLKPMVRAAARQPNTYSCCTLTLRP